MNDKNNVDLKECPYCKSKEGYYAKFQYKGRGIQKYSFDENEIADNGDMYDCLSSTYSSKYYYCLNCNKRIALVEE